MIILNFSVQFSSHFLKLNKKNLCQKNKRLKLKIYWKCHGYRVNTEKNARPLWYWTFTEHENNVNKYKYISE